MLLAKLKRRTLAETVVALNGLSIGELRELANANECFGDYGLASHCPERSRCRPVCPLASHAAAYWYAREYAFDRSRLRASYGTIVPCTLS